VKKSIFFLVLAGLFLWGCATTQDLKKSEKNLDQKIDALKEETAKLQKGLNENGGAIKAIQKNQADTGADLTALREQVKKLRGTSEEIRRDLDALRAERKERDAKLHDLALRIGFIENFIGVGKKSELNGNSEKKEDRQGNARSARNGRGVKSDRESVYSTAYKDLKEGRYPEARKGFLQYIEKFPHTDLTDNAQFWIGESYYSQNNYEKAILEYEKVVKKYPEGDKVPHALLKQGLSFLKLGDKASARLLFKQVMKDYPSTNQARIAKAKLAEIK